MKILIIGGGGREHAIAWRLAKEGHKIYAAPGNPGIAEIGTNLHATGLDAAKAVDPDLTVVGPEAPLAQGIVDQFRAAGLPIVGPTRELARLEASKIYAKVLMQRLGVPTARFVLVENVEAGIEALSQFHPPVAIKADGLATGKGVIIARTIEEAEAAVRTLGPRLVIEEFLSGEEASFIVLSDGRRFTAFDVSQDHKTLGEGDTGPNTGGMGAYSDGRILGSSEVQRVIDTIIEPVISTTGFTGFLYAGLMMTSSGPRVLEFNVRLGDPEAQAILHRLDDSTDFAGALLQSATGSLREQLRSKFDPSVCVVLAASGYPGKPRTGDPIQGISECRAQVFQAGTRIGSRGIETAGGRVLGITASGRDLSSAISNAYAGVEAIHFDNMQYRRDIGRKGLKRWPPATIEATGT
ncbi:MAG TPA: phosphoribosylamine--glycine ligase [Bryobacteraceae bacterium]|nr:phosphoribosylamine--glycine ligase [Bryobacteraceae bacterium]